MLNLDINPKDRLGSEKVSDLDWGCEAQYPLPGEAVLDTGLEKEKSAILKWLGVEFTLI